MMEEQLPLGLRFSILGRCFKRILDEHLKEMELTGVQFGVLMALHRLEDRGADEIYQRDLEHCSHVTHPTMTEIIKRLEKKGYISCTRSESDRRHKCIAMTERAKELCCQVNAAEMYAEQQLCGVLSEEEKMQLMQITDKLMRNACSMKGEDKA